MENMQRPIILHFHIFKNAGTTIEWILEKNFPKHAARLDPDNPKLIIPMETVMNYLEKNKKTQAISSHQIRFPIHQDLSFIFLPIVFIRHPIDRAISVYNFNKRRRDIISEGIKKAKELNLSDYINWHLNHKRNSTMKNYQVLYLSHQTNVFQPLNDDDYNNALTNLKKSFVIGLVNRFDESIVLAEELLKNYFDNIDFSYIRQEITSDREQNFDERLRKTQSEIDQQILDKLTEQNRLDLKLFSDMNSELNNRIKKISDFDSKLESFQNHCLQIPTNLSIGNSHKRIMLKVNN